MAAPCEDEKQELLKVEQDVMELRKEVKLNPNLDKSILQLDKMLESLDQDLTKAEMESKRLLDLDSDGRLTCAELRQILTTVGLKEEEVTDFISRLDADHDGYIDLEHVKKLRNLDITVDSLKVSLTSSDDEGAKRRAVLHKKIHQYHKSMKKDIPQ